MAAQQPHRKFLSWLHHDEQAEPLASPQLPPATFPTSYRASIFHSNGPAKATAQNDSAPCAATPKPPKKPCALTTWLAKMKSWRNSFGCGGCHHERPATCCHECHCCHGSNQPVSASPQGNAPAAPIRSASLLQNSPYLAARPAFLSRTEASDIAQDGPVIDPSLAQGLDKTPQR